jgi:GNAT superfamily N-acetyltransferase
MTLFRSTKAAKSSRQETLKLCSMGAFEIRCLTTLSPQQIHDLCDVLLDCVDGGASVSFMWPMTRAKAEQFWKGVAEGAARGERLVFVAAEAQGPIVGTAQIVWAEPENQPHRADLAKMLVHRSARRAGVGAALLEAAERAALDHGRTLLVLDTATDGDGYRLYARNGWQRCGEIPHYALLPDGTPCPTTIYFKSLRA